MRKANPSYEKEERRRKEFETKKLKIKKKQKLLQQTTLEEDMKMQDRKIYKKFIKYNKWFLSSEPITFKL